MINGEKRAKWVPHQISQRILNENDYIDVGDCHGHCSERYHSIFFIFSISTQITEKNVKLSYTSSSIKVSSTDASTPGCYDNVLGINHSLTNDHINSHKASSQAVRRSLR